MDRKELISRTGSLLQIGGATPFIYDDGRGKGTSAYRVRTGTGLDFTVLRDRALDVFECFYKGVNLALITRNGLVSPERLGTRFGQNMSGGLFFTAGLRNTGAEAEGFPQHGRVHLLPACNYLLDVPADDSGYATVRVENPSVGFGVYITARKDTLPYFNEWKSLKPGIYTLAIEPSSTRLRGILEERKLSGMGVIPPFESTSTHFRFGVYDL